VRLFVAVWPDEPTRTRLQALQLELGRSKGLRFVGPARWHVTLRFLGEVPDDDIPPLADALLAATATGPAAGPTTAVECRLGPGTGWFTGVRVLQLPAAGIDALAAAVRRATAPIVPENRADPPFNGHLTLARAKGRRLSVAALGEMANIPFEAAFPVDAIDLVSSQPSPDGHAYTTLARAPLHPAT
jgi:RNA 2',3'-cyclic 3'-phosphodiesterase